MAEILIIDTDSVQAGTVAEHLRIHLEVSSTIFDSVESAGEKIASADIDIMAIILNLDASPENYSPFPDMPTIVVTNGVPTSGRQIAFAANVLDYIPDCRGYNLEYVLQLVKRVMFARNAKILVASKEKVNRTLMRKLLGNKGYSVIEASGAKAVMTSLYEHKNICMLLIDGDMCEEKNFAMIKNIRNDFKKNQLSILALCDRAMEYQRIMLLRCGANDCIDKPLRIEEFQVRVMLNLQLMEVISELTEFSNMDFLTRLYNRKYLFEIGSTLFENYKRDALELTLAMIDIDDMKSINDTHGHLVGDMVIKKTAKALNSNLRSADVIARIGGEEFCVLATKVRQDNAFAVFERVRKSINEEIIDTPAGPLKFGICIGATTGIRDSFEQMIHDADTLLYKAKAAGKNRVIIG